MHRTYRIGFALSAAVIGLVLAGAGCPTLQAQNAPSLKELLGRAQSEAEKRAVEDLIDKLRPRPGQQPAAPSADTAPKDTGAGQSAAVPPIQNPKPVPAEAEAKTEPPAETKPAEIAGPKDGQPASEKAAATSEPASEQKGGAAPSETERQASQASSGAAAMAPEVAVAKASKEELPSVDLEILFEYNSAKLTPEALTTLATLGRALTDARLAGSTFLIAGHTDAKGGRGYNLRLSTLRARAVRDALIADFGLDPGRLKAQGFGSRHLKNREAPLAPENRRVQIVNVVAPPAH